MKIFLSFLGFIASVFLSAAIWSLLQWLKTITIVVPNEYLGTVVTIFFVVVYFILGSIAITTPIFAPIAIYNICEENNL